jgi:hypothetical protein
MKMEKMVRVRVRVACDEKLKADPIVNVTYGGVPLGQPQHFVEFEYRPIEGDGGSSL